MSAKQTSGISRRLRAFGKRYPRFTRGLGYTTTAVMAFGFGLALAAWNLVCRGTRCPSIDALERYQPRQTSRLYAIDGRFVAELGVERRTLATLNEIPKVVQDAFVVTEDKRFYSHRGIDWLRVPGATLVNLRAGSFVEGFSTITMQLARNIFPTKLTREKSPTRKLKEIVVARRIEKRYPKDKILELYLNQINLGAGAHGVETASQRYFGKPVRYLNLAEAATLAAIPKAPTRYNPRRFPARAVQRRNTIIELMRRDGAVESQQASLAKAYPLALARRVESGEIAPYFAEWVRQTLHERFGDRLYEQGLKVYTTLDLDMQAAAERAVESQMRSIEGGGFGRFPHLTYEQYVARGERDQGSGMESPYLQAAFVAIDPHDGSVRAMVGGRDYGDSQFNRATQAMRQPGSTFKPIVYATAVHQGRPPSTIIDDAPINLPQLDGTDWTPENYDLKFQGPMTMRRGLYESRNLVAIRLGMELGENNVVEMARQFGITTPIPPYPSIHIGSAEVYPLELIGGYTTFANLGTRTTPNAILRVEDSEGNVLWKTKADSVPVLSAGEAWVTVNMLKDVVLRGTAVGRVWNAGFRVPSAGKTGTTNDGADVWYVGFTANLVAGIWVGFDKPKKIMADAQGGRLAAPAYTSFMIEVYRRKPEPPDWPRPSTVTSHLVDSATGLLASPLCADRAYTEYFLFGTEPQRTCGGSTSPGDASAWMGRPKSGVPPWPRRPAPGGAPGPMILYTSRWVLPIVRPSFEHGAVGVDRGRIVYVGPAADAPEAEVVDLGECALMPGLVNTHSHLELTAMRGWLEQLTFRQWIIRLTKARQAVLDPDRLLASARLGIAEGLLAGITTYADTCESGVVHQAMRDMGVRGVMYLEVFGPQTEQAQAAIQSLTARLSPLRSADTTLVRTGISPHAPYSVSDALFVGAGELATAEELPIAVHAAESEAEQRLVTEAAGDFADALRARGIPVTPRATSTIALLQKTGVLRARPLLIHCVRTTSDDIRRIADNGCRVAHCPASNAKLGHGIANLSGFLDAKIAVGVGSDSVASNNRMDMLDEARLALMLGRASQRRWDSLPTTVGLELATSRGAEALGLASEIGTLEVGKSADLSAFPMDGLHAQPVQDPESALIFATTGRGARLVVVAGSELVRNGQLVRGIQEDLMAVQSAAADLGRFSTDGS